MVSEKVECSGIVEDRVAARLRPGWATILASFAIVAFARRWPTTRTTLLLALSPIGLASGWGIRRYLEGAKTSPRA